MRVTKLGGQQGHGLGAVISKSQLCSWSRSGDTKDLVKSCRECNAIQDLVLLFIVHPYNFQGFFKTVSPTFHAILPLQKKLLI